MPAFSFSGFAFRAGCLRALEIGQPVERALQDEDGGMLIDDLGAAVAAHVGSRSARVPPPRLTAARPIAQSADR